MRERGVGRDGYAWWQFVGLVLLLAGAVVVSYLALQKDLDADEAGFAVDPAQVDPSTSQDPSASPSPDPSPSQGAGVGEPPEVPDKRRADFTLKDKLPDGAALVDLADNDPGLTVDGGLTHGPSSAEAPGRGVLELRLNEDVRSLGFVVRFTGEGSGTAFLSAAGSSFASAADGAAPAPTGIVLTVRADGWSLAAGSGEDASLASGRVPLIDGAVEYRLIRDEDRLFVLDPTGKTTFVERAGLAQDGGRWGAWGLSEDSPEQTPAVIEQVWLG